MFNNESSGNSGKVCLFYLQNRCSLGAACRDSYQTEQSSPSTGLFDSQPFTSSPFGAAPSTFGSTTPSCFSQPPSSSPFGQSATTFGFGSVPTTTGLGSTQETGNPPTIQTNH